MRLLGFAYPRCVCLSANATDPLKKQWVQELESMRLGMLDLRLKLSDALKKKTNSNRFEFVENHRGMFSRLGLTEDNVTKLRDEFGIYMVSDSRINIAGLQAEKIDLVATAVAEVI